jgi:hypothetical protein
VSVETGCACPDKQSFLGLVGESSKMKDSDIRASFYGLLRLLINSQELYTAVSPSNRLPTTKLPNRRPQTRLAGFPREMQNTHKRSTQSNGPNLVS